LFYQIFGLKINKTMNFPNKGLLEPALV